MNDCLEAKPINQLFKQELAAINLGLSSFADNLKATGAKVIHVEWKPPAGGDATIIDALNRIDNSDVDIVAANQKAADIILKGKPILLDIGIAGETIPGMHRFKILHSGPPITWERMSGPVKGAVIGGLIYEGIAKTQEEAESIAASGKIEFEPCHHSSAVGPMAGVVTSKMPVWIVENATYGNRAYCTINEGLGKVLRYGAFSEEVIERLSWIETELAPILKRAIALHGPIDLKTVIAQALQMGDEVHNRNRAATSLIIRELAPWLVQLNESSSKIAKVFSFLNANDHFFLNLSMPACKCVMDAAKNINGSSIVVAMARNGTDFGIRISGLGDRWFTGPASIVDGLYLPGYSADDAAPDLGDSTITETAGIGGFCMAAAPAIVQFVGGTSKDALRFTNAMYEITTTENLNYKIPALNFRGSPTGIDVCKIIETGILPVINTGIAHKEPGVGMVGAGLVKPPENCFKDAVIAFADKYGK